MRPENNIYVVGYPKSGNTYTSRLLGEILNAPVQGELGATPIATEGLNRSSKYIVRQLHLKATEDNSGSRFLVSATQASLPNWNGQRIVHVYRDPRDVAVSCMFYWEISSLKDTLIYMRDATDGCPLRVHGPWMKFVSGWINAPDYVVQVSYEELVNKPHATVQKALNELNIELPTDERLAEAVKAQEFGNKRRELDRDSSGRPYGRTIQLKNLRNGKSGDWVNHFAPDTAKIAEEAFRPMMNMLGYGDEHEWRKLVEA